MHFFRKILIDVFIFFPMQKKRRCFPCRFLPAYLRDDHLHKINDWRGRCSQPRIPSLLSELFLERNFLTGAILKESEMNASLILIRLYVLFMFKVVENYMITYWNMISIIRNITCFPAKGERNTHNFYLLYVQEILSIKMYIRDIPTNIEFCACYFLTYVEMIYFFKVYINLNRMSRTPQKISNMYKTHLVFNFD